MGILHGTPRAVFHRKGHKDCREKACYLAQCMWSGNLPSYPQSHDPGKPTDHTFEELVQLVQAHRNPPPSVTVQRFTISTRLQKDGETVSQFVAELRRLSEHCAFDVSLDGMLRDRLVCSVRDTKVQHRLLAEPNLTFKKAFEICQSAEVAEKNARELQMSQKYKVPYCWVIISRLVQRNLQHLFRAIGVMANSPRLPFQNCRVSPLQEEGPQCKGMSLQESARPASAGSWFQCDSQAR